MPPRRRCYRGRSRGHGGPGTLNNVDLQRTFYGATLDRLNNSSDALNQEQTDLSQQQNSLIGADLPTAATNLAQAETTLNAALAAFGQISQNNLLDYLK